MRPVVADTVLSKAGATIPIAPVNPSQEASAPLTPEPSVVNKINPALQGSGTRPPNEGEPTYTSVPDPVRRYASSQPIPNDWTIKRPAPEKVEEPPQKPIAEVLIDNLKSMWNASASAVQLQQIGNQIAPPVQQSPTQVPGELAKQALTYKPTKINKNENI